MLVSYVKKVISENNTLILVLFAVNYLDLKMCWKMTSVFAITLMCIVWSVAEQADQLPSSTDAKNVEKIVNIADAVNEFGYKLTLTMMKEAKDQNVVVSPTSVAGLLAMTLLGTIGKTHEELAAALGFSQDILESRHNHEEFGELLRTLNESSSKTLYADAMFVDTHSRIRDLYRDYLRRVYSGDALGVDFTKAGEVKDIINQWVDSHTEGKIENFLKKSLPATTKAVLLSALYFCGQWKTPFVEEQTRKFNFTKPSNATVMADLMVNMGQFRYKFSPEDDLHIIALPYNDSITTLYAIQPYGPLRRRPTLQNLMTHLNYSRINQIIETMENAECVLRFPKMDLKIETKLEEHLKALGVRSLFTPGQANFALMVHGNMVTNTTDEILLRITGDSDEEFDDARGVKEVLEGLPNPGIYVDTVIHDVKLTINEYGTEAVAATSGVLARTAKLFLADSPFYMFIRNERTKLITFSAVINDPTA